MDEVLEAAELVADSELEGVVVWLLRILGAIAILGGLGLWLLTEMGLLWTPALLLVVGGLLITIPGILLELVGG